MSPLWFLRKSNAALADARGGVGWVAGHMQPRKPHNYIWRDLIKPSLRFLFFCIFFILLSRRMLSCKQFFISFSSFEWNYTMIGDKLTYFSNLCYCTLCWYNTDIQIMLGINGSIWNIFTYFIFQKIGFDSLYKLFHAGTVWMKCQILFSWKYKKYNSNDRLLNLPREWYVLIIAVLPSYSMKNAFGSWNRRRRKAAVTTYAAWADESECIKMYPASILRKSISGRHRPVRVADGPMTARCRFT